MLVRKRTLHVCFNPANLSDQIIRPHPRGEIVTDRDDAEVSRLIQLGERFEFCLHLLWVAVYGRPAVLIKEEPLLWGVRIIERFLNRRDAATSTADNSQPQQVAAGGEPVRFCFGLGT